jgi:hypothetical protein
MRLLPRALFSAGLILALSTTATYSGTVPLSGPGFDCGWSASWDASLDGLVDVVAQGQVGGICVIEKAAEFTQGPSLLTGLFPSIVITFTQTTQNAAPVIAINDEILTNSTGVLWTDFHMIIVDDGDAVFDPAATAASGGGGPIGWTIGPQFTNAAFSDGDTRLDIFDGPGVPDGTQWFPGDGATNGELFVNLATHDIDGGEAPLVWSLKETPTPEPGTLALLALGGGLAAARRRR